MAVTDESQYLIKVHKGTRKTTLDIASATLCGGQLLADPVLLCL